MAAPAMPSQVAAGSASASSRRPLVTLLDGRDCSVEMPILKDVATVAFCDAQSSSEIHDKVLNEAYGALLWDCITLQRDDLLKFKALKVIIKIGSGCDNIDVTAASELGIALSNIPHVGIEETADSTMGHVLSLFRQNVFWANAMKEGKRIFGPEALRDSGGNCHSLRGKTLGIVGLGRTGSAVALRAKVFGLNVIFYDPNLPDGIEISLGVEKIESLPELLHRADCVSLHCSCNPNTRNMINEVTLKSMKQGAFLVNTASAHLIDEMALATMLREGRLAGAALDVHQHERTSLTDGPLADCPNLIVTPHCSWYSPTSDKRMREAAAHEMRRIITTKMPSRLRYCVNADLLAFNARRQILLSGDASLSGTSAAGGALSGANNTLPARPPNNLSAGGGNGSGLTGSSQAAANPALLRGTDSASSSANNNNFNLNNVRTSQPSSSLSGLPSSSLQSPLSSQNASQFSSTSVSANSSAHAEANGSNNNNNSTNYLLPSATAADMLQRTLKRSMPQSSVNAGSETSSQRFASPSEQQQPGNLSATRSGPSVNNKYFMPLSMSAPGNSHLNGAKRSFDAQPPAVPLSSDGTKKVKSGGSNLNGNIPSVLTKATVSERADV